MNKTVLLIVSIFSVKVTLGQVEVASSGHVGIGTATPEAPLHVASAGASMLLDNNGFLSAKDATGIVRRVSGISPLNYIYYGNVDNWGDGSSDTLLLANRSLIYYTNGNERMRIDSAGNVGIGTTSPSYKLQVSGQVRATSFISDTATYADFVFKPGYQLPTLGEVEAHIEVHGHLPGVPSEAQVAKEGLDLAAMQVVLLQKIEELTLHQIAQEKEINALRAKIARLKNQD